MENHKENRQQNGRFIGKWDVTKISSLLNKRGIVWNQNLTANKQIITQK